jgi:hypothetical protein
LTSFPFWEALSAAKSALISSFNQEEELLDEREQLLSIGRCTNENESGNKPTDGSKMGAAITLLPSEVTIPSDERKRLLSIGSYTNENESGSKPTNGSKMATITLFSKLHNQPQLR